MPAPYSTKPTDNFAAPQTPLEEKIAAIWTDVLGVERVGRTDNFFDLGGHSLLATQVISQMRKKFKIEIPLRSLFESPTVAELALEVERLSERTTALLLRELETISDEEAEHLLDLEQHGLEALEIDRAIGAQFDPAQALDGLSRRAKFTGQDDLVFVENELGEHVGNGWQTEARLTRLERQGVAR